MNRTYHNPILYDSCYYNGCHPDLDTLEAIADYTKKLFPDNDYYVVADCKAGHTETGRRDTGTHQRDQLQRVARGRIAGHRLRAAPDRRWHAERGDDEEIPPLEHSRHTRRTGPDRSRSQHQDGHQLAFPHRPARSGKRGR